MAGGRPTTVTPAARTALQAARIDGRTVTITDTLPGPTWTRVKKLLELAGGTYDTGRSSWTFPGPADAVIDGMLTAGQVVADRHTHGYVPTPPQLAARLVGAEFGNAGQLPEGSLVLEPSAGDGRIVQALLEANPGLDILALEPDQNRFNQLLDINGPAAKRTTLEEYASSKTGRAGRFDLVVANPPFHVTDRRDVWAEHVILMFERVKPGGRVVAIVPSTAANANEVRTWAKSPLDSVLRDLADDGGSFTPLPASDFPGLGVGVGVLVLDRPVHDGRPGYLYRDRDENATPVLVDEPRTSWVAALHTPVQTWYSGWCGKERVFRNVGRCFNCGEPVWSFDDGEDDPRGVLGVATARRLDPADFDLSGPTILQCSRLGCWTGVSDDAAIAAGKAKHWKPRAEKFVELRRALISVLTGPCAYSPGVSGSDRHGPCNGDVELVRSGKPFSRAELEFYVCATHQPAQRSTAGGLPDDHPVIVWAAVRESVRGESWQPPFSARYERIQAAERAAHGLPADAVGSEVRDAEGSDARLIYRWSLPYLREYAALLTGNSLDDVDQRAARFREPATSADGDHAAATEQLRQAVAAFMADTTGQVVTDRRTDLCAIDQRAAQFRQRPTSIRIERHRRSVTQGEVSVYHQGELINRFGDDINLCTDSTHDHDGAQMIGGWHGRGDQYWIEVVNAHVAKQLRQAVGALLADGASVGESR